MADLNILRGLLAPEIVSAIEKETVIQDESEVALRPRRNFIYRPGGPAQGNVYNDWDVLTASIITIAGFKSIEFDPTGQGSDISIPVGGPYDMTEVEWFGARENALPGDRRVVVRIPEGATFTNLRRFRGNIRIVIECTATVPDTTLIIGDTIFLSENAEIKRDGTIPLWEASGLTTNDDIELLMDTGAKLLGPGAIINLPIASTSLSIDMGVSAQVEADTISSAATTTITATPRTGSTVFDSSQPNALGGIVDSPDTNVRMLPDVTLRTTAANLTRNQFARFDTTAGNIVANLPAASGLFGQAIGVINSAGANNVVVTPAGGDTVDDLATLNIGAGERVLFLSDGINNWIRALA